MKRLGLKFQLLDLEHGWHQKVKSRQQLKWQFIWVIDTLSHCALIYENEDEVGDAIAEKLHEGAVRREDLFVTSKLWNTFHRSDLVKKTLLMSLKMLKLSYLDLYLMHWPMGYAEDGDLLPKNDKGEFVLSDVDYLETWKAMEALVDEGLVKAIGISNFNCEQIDRILSNCRIPPACLQIESSPYITNDRLIKFAQERGITVVAYSPLDFGLHSYRGGKEASGLIQQELPRRWRLVA